MFRCPESRSLERIDLVHVVRLPLLLEQEVNEVLEVLLVRVRQAKIFRPRFVEPESEVNVDVNRTWLIFSLSDLWARC